MTETNAWPIVLGIDPGTRVTGYGIVVVRPDGLRLFACGVLRAPNNLHVARRLAILADGFEELIAKVTPHWVAVESAFTARNPQAALRIGEARGMILAMAGRSRLNVAEIAPGEAKKAVTGNGGASKEQVARMVPLLLGERTLDVPPDATDALAVALAQVQRMTRPGGPRERGSGSHLARQQRS